MTSSTATGAANTAGGTATATDAQKLWGRAP